jgi:hypothetical protein
MQYEEVTKASQEDRLTYENDWEYRTYFVDGKEINALREVEVAGREVHRVL